MLAASSRRVLHVVPSDSACGSLREALRSIRRDDDVLPFRDDLSCGPIDPDDPEVREEWWSYDEEGFVRDDLRAFWEAVDAHEGRIIVWFSRHAAFDLSFFLHWADRLGDRPYEVIDVTGQCPPCRDRDGRPAVSKPLVTVAIAPTAALPALLGTERPLTLSERAQAREHWRRLKAENSYFRIVTDGVLASAPEDHFDASLLACASCEWRKSARVIGECLSRSWQPYVQVHDMVLARRLEALVEAGHLQAQGDLDDLRASEVRLPR